LSCLSLFAFVGDLAWIRFNAATFIRGAPSHFTKM
jgi:hypothetical protein